MATYQNLFLIWLESPGTQECKPHRPPEPAVKGHPLGCCHKNWALDIKIRTSNVCTSSLPGDTASAEHSIGRTQRMHLLLSSLMCTSLEAGLSGHSYEDKLVDVFLSKTGSWVCCPLRCPGGGNQLRALSILYSPVGSTSLSPLCQPEPHNLEVSLDGGHQNRGPR